MKLKPFSFFLLTIAGIINAIGVTIFLAPVALYDSGISGTSMLISQLTPEYISLSLVLLLLNVPLFLYGFKRQGRVFTIYSIYVVSIYSLSAYLITYVLPIDVNIASPLAGTDLLLCAIFGGIISGTGSGLAILFGGAMDGIDVLAVIFAKKINISVGTFVMTFNVILYIVCGISLNSWILPLYSIITYMAAMKMVDFLVEGISRSNAARIVTEKEEEVLEILLDRFGTGATIMDVKGGYSKKDKTMIYIIVNRFQVGTLKSLVHEIDPKAYIAISDVAEVYSANKN